MNAIWANVSAMFGLPPGFVRYFFTSQLRPLPVPTTSFEGKTAIVTGANVGLGLEAARHFARLGASKVILACRSTEKGEAAKRDIELTAAAAPGTIEVWPVDLCSYESVKKFCRRAENLERLDVLMENAGIAIGTYHEAEGYESTITINVLSTLLMALMLLPKMRETAARFNTTPHLTVVASDAHFLANFREKSEAPIFDYYKRKDVMSDNRYNVSKLLDVLAARELASRLDASSPSQKSPVVVNSLNPGFCRTELFRYATFPFSILVHCSVYLIGRTSEMGSRVLVAAACTGPESHGKYLDSCKIHNPSPYVLSEEGAQMQKRVFGEILEILESVEPGVSKNI